MLVSKPTHGGGSPLGIDLEAGVAKITVRRAAPAAGPTDGAEATDQPDEGAPAEQTEQTDQDGDRPGSAPA